MKNEMALENWTEEQVQVAGDLGMDEIERRVAALHSYYLYDTVASIYDSDRALSPVQATAWAAFAKTLGPDFMVKGNSIVTRKSPDDLALQVVSNEIFKRKQDAMKAKKDADNG